MMTERCYISCLGENPDLELVKAKNFTLKLGLRGAGFVRLVEALEARRTGNSVRQDQTQ